MITITPNVPPPNMNQGMNRMPNAGFNQNQRFNHQGGGRQNFFQPFRAYRQGGNGPVVFDPEFDGKRLRKSAMRKTVDYNASIIKMLETRVWQRDFRDRRSLQPDAMYIPDVMPPAAYQDNPINAVTTRFVKTATNKMRCPIFCMAWTPEGRRLVTGASSGEFTLWNGLTFNFETILQAHDTPVRTMVWSHNEMWMVTADHSGFVKYWQSNMNNVKMFMAHQEAIRGISFSPTDSKFASCSDDGTIKVWDFYRCQEERTLRGHGADVKCVHWHPQKGLIISGSKDNQQPVKLWDPKTGTSLATIHAHKSTVMDVKWNDNGNWFVTASRDHLLKLFDIRNLNTEVQVFRGHKKESSSVAWHPTHEGLFCSGGSDGAILFWHVGAEKEVGAIEQAHDSIVWTLAWHPMGHILCSGSNDHTSKFWTRNRPGDSMRDKYNLNTLPASMSGLEEQEIEDVTSVIPGMGPEDKVDLNLSATVLPGLTAGAIPGLEDMDISADDKNKAQSKKVPYSKPIPKNFQAHWNDTGKLDDLDDDSKDGIDPIALLNQLIEQQPGVKLVKDLVPESLYIYGKVLTVEPGSTLAKVISEGGEKLMKYLNSGAVKELRDVIPHYDNDAPVNLDDTDSDPDDEDDCIIMETSDPPLPDASTPEHKDEEQVSRGPPSKVSRFSDYVPPSKNMQNFPPQNYHNQKFQGKGDHFNQNQKGFQDGPSGFGNQMHNNFQGSFMDGPPQGMRPPQHFNQQDGFRPNQPDSFRSNQQDGFRPNQSDGFRQSQPDSFRLNQQDGFRPNQPDSFRSNQQDNFRPNQPDNFRPNQQDNFRPNQDNFRSNQDSFRPNQAGQFNQDRRNYYDDKDDSRPWDDDDTQDNYYERDDRRNDRGGFRGSFRGRRGWHNRRHPRGVSH